MKQLIITVLIIVISYNSIGGKVWWGKIKPKPRAVLPTTPWNK
jgi:hypothetical protein